MFGFLYSWFFVLISLWISCTKTQPLPNSRIPDTSDSHTQTQHHTTTTTQLLQGTLATSSCLCPSATPCSTAPFCSCSSSPASTVTDSEFPSWTRNCSSSGRGCSRRASSSRRSRYILWIIWIMTKEKHYRCFFIIYGLKSVAWFTRRRQPIYNNTQPMV